MVLSLWRRIQRRFDARKKRFHLHHIELGGCEEATAVLP